MRRLLIIALLFTAAGIAAQENGQDTNGDGQPDRWIIVNAGNVAEIHLDRNYDGKVDYIVSYNEANEKVGESLDFNYDGEFDDFYYYARDKMKRREIDTNFDGKIDIWVYLDGIYIEKYQKDINFDGIIDITEDYTEE